MTMPSRSAASMTLLPLGTSTSRSSMISLGMERTSFLANMLSDFVFKRIEKADYGFSGPRSQSAVRVPDLFAQSPQIGDVFFFSLAIFDSPKKVAHIRQPFPAGRTPPARLAGEELHQVQSGRHKAGLVVKDHYGCCTQAVPDIFQIFKIHRDVIVLPGHESGRSTSRKACLKFRTMGHSSAVLIDYLTESGADRQLYCAREIHFSAYAVQLRARAVRS